MHLVTKIKAKQLFLFTSILTEDMRTIHRKHFVYLKKANPEKSVFNYHSYKEDLKLIFN